MSPSSLTRFHESVCLQCRFPGIIPTALLRFVMPHQGPCLTAELVRETLHPRSFFRFLISQALRVSRLLLALLHLPCQLGCATAFLPHSALVKKLLGHRFPHPAAWTASVIHYFREFRSEVVGAAQNEGTWPCDAIPVVGGGPRLQDWSDSLK